MKRKSPSGRYSVEDMNKLVFSILSGTTLTEEDLSKMLNYNKGYITQCRTRGKVSERFMRILQEELKKKTAASHVETTVDIDEVRSIKAAFKSLANFVAILAAKTQGRPAADILEELEQSSHVIYRELKKG